jgi:hypothetical protein
MKISRSFTVAAGNYDVFLIAKEPTPEKAPKNAPPPKMSAIKQSVTVPDFWNSELQTSSVIVAQRIDPLPAPLTPQQQADRPYALGMMEILPTFETKFTKKAELSTFMLIYNPKVDSANKPDVSVEYNFYQKLAGQPEKFFNKTNPQNLNAQTLPPNFDFAAGHQLQSGQAVPAGVVPGRRLPSRDQGHRQDREQNVDAGNQLHRQSLVTQQRAERSQMSTSSRMTRRAVVGGLVLLCLPAVSTHRARDSCVPSRTSRRLRRFDSRHRPGRAWARRCAGATVSALGASSAFAVSDRAGHFEMRTLSPGPYLLRAHQTGFVASRGQVVDVRPSARASSAIALRHVTAVNTPSTVPVLAAGIGATVDAPAPPVDPDATANTATRRAQPATTITVSSRGVSATPAERS